MGWVKIDDNFPDHPKLTRAGPLGLVLQIRALCYCSKHLTDGVIPSSAVRALAHGLGTRSSKRWAEILYTCGLWSKLPGGNFLVHDYLHYNPSKKERLRFIKHQRLAAKSRWNQSDTSMPPASIRHVPNACRPASPPTPPTPPLIGTPLDPLSGGEVVGDPQNSNSEPPPLERSELQPQRSPEYVLSCGTCMAMLRELNNGSARAYTAPGRAGEWMHQAHAGRSREEICEVIRRQVARLAASPGKSRFLSPSVLFKPENWDTTVNDRTTARTDSLPDWRAALKGKA